MKIREEVANEEPVDALFRFDQGSSVVGDIGTSLDNLQEEEDNGPDNHNDRRDVSHDVELRVGGPLDKNATVEVDDADLDEAISWHHNYVDDEFDLWQGHVSGSASDLREHCVIGDVPFSWIPVPTLSDTPIS